MKSRTKSPSSPCGGGVGGGGAGVGPICPLRNEESAKSYPSISAAYWLPAPTPTPYQVPVHTKLWVLLLLLRAAKMGSKPVSARNGRTSFMQTRGRIDSFQEKGLRCVDV
uniref:Uncharacterized protein n=1 Tax=Anopheles coluzzii TaxID=1518534 RepID=A0A8W7PIF6_ANOCL